MIEVLKQIQQCLKDKMYAHAEMYLSEAIAELESQEPVCPECKAGVLYECVACSSNNYPPQRTEPPDWFPAVENILKEYGLQAMDFVADFKEAMKDAEPQRTWVGLTDEDWKEIEDMPDTFDQGVAWAQAKLKELNT